MFAARYKKIGAKILYYRRLQGLSQEQLAEKANISASYLSKIEHGTYSQNLPLTTLFIIAEALGVNADELIKDR